MTVDATSNATRAGTFAGSSLSSATEQQDRFMKLLVAQMRHQDPLNPLDNAQVTSQVAQINTVAGIEQLNATVGALLQAFGQQQAMASSQLAGRDVLVEGTRLALADGQATGGVTLAKAADRVDVEVLDPAGRVVRTLSLGALPAGTRSFHWDGRLDDGSTAADGSWRLRVTARAGGQPVDATPLAAARVLAVMPDAEGGTARIDLGAAGVLPASAIRSYL